MLDEGHVAPALDEAPERSRVPVEGLNVGALALALQVSSRVGGSAHALHCERERGCRRVKKKLKDATAERLG